MKVMIKDNSNQFILMNKGRMNRIMTKTIHQNPSFEGPGEWN